MKLNCVFRIKWIVNVQNRLNIIQCVSRLCSSKTAIENVLADEVQDITKDEIEKKRDVCRLPENIRHSHLEKKMVPLQQEHQFQMRMLRKYYAFYGKESGLNPGIMWPSKDYLKELKEYEKIAYVPLKEMVAKVEEDKRKEIEYRKEREEFIRTNMAKHESLLKEFKARKARKKAEAEVQLKEKEKLIEVVQEYIGYEMDPRDARFQEILKQKEEEDKKAKKKVKKQEREQKLLAMLIQAGMEGDASKEKGSASESEPVEKDSEEKT